MIGKERMCDLVKKRDLNQAADRFYDYIMAHRDQVYRYVVAAVFTWILQFIFSRMIPLVYGVALAFALRLLLLFFVCKYWVYRERGSGFFCTARQAMLAVMIFILLVLAVNYISLWLGNSLLIGYIMQALQEVSIFLMFQLLIFKQED